MALNDRKIVVFANPVASLPDHPSQSGMTAAQLKAAFDANATGEIKTSINGIVDDLVAIADGASGADNIGATAIKAGGATKVQGILEELQADKIGLSGDENIAGIKTFSSSPIIPAPSANMNAANKKYVDDIAASSALGNATYLGGQSPAYYGKASDVAANTEQINNLAALITKVYEGTISLDAKNTVIENWTTMPAGNFICGLCQGDMKFAQVGKVNDLYGSIMIFGYHPNVAKPIYGRINGGVWDWTEIVTTKQEDWIMPTLINGWVTKIGFNNPARYMKDTLGFVHLKGLVSSGTIGQAIFSLPEGYRPNESILIITTSNDASGITQVIPDTGAVIAFTGSNVWYSLDGISFKAER